MPRRDPGLPSHPGGPYTYPESARSFGDHRHPLEEIDPNAFGHSARPIHSTDDPLGVPPTEDAADGTLVVVHGPDEGSGYATGVDWTDVDNKPDFATRWPSFEEVTGELDWADIDPATVPEEASRWPQVDEILPDSYGHNVVPVAVQDTVTPPSAEDGTVLMVYGPDEGAGYADGVDWSDVDNKPATATRWPEWSEVTSKPSYFESPLAADVDTSGGTSIIYPEGASVRVNDSGQTGAIKIRLPHLWPNTMIRMRVEVYTYSGASRTFWIEGYPYSAGETWANNYAAQLGGTKRTVRFGNDGTKACIWIGETGSNWSYPYVRVSEVQVSHSANSGAEDWNDGWQVSFVTSFDTVQRTTSPAFVWHDENVPSTATRWPDLHEVGPDTFGHSAKPIVPQSTLNESISADDGTVLLVHGAESGSGYASGVDWSDVDNKPAWARALVSTSNWDLDTIEARLVAGATNGPSGQTSFMGAHFPHGSVPGYATQFGGRDDSFRVRTKDGGAWTPWRELWHTGNFDPNTKADLAGATFTGDVSVGTGGNVGIGGAPAYPLHVQMGTTSRSRFDFGTSATLDVVSYAGQSGQPYSNSAGIFQSIAGLDLLLMAHEANIRFVTGSYVESMHLTNGGDLRLPRGNSKIEVGRGGSNTDAYLDLLETNGYGLRMWYDGAANYGSLGTLDNGSFVEVLRINRNSTTAHFFGNVVIPAGKALYLDSGGDTYLQEYSANEIRVIAGGGTLMRFIGGNSVRSVVSFYPHTNNNLRLGTTSLRWENVLSYKLNFQGIELSRALDHGRITTPHGWMNFGPGNASWSHFQTSSNGFYFYKKAFINGDLQVEGDLLDSAYNGNPYRPIVAQSTLDESINARDGTLIVVHE